MKFDLLSVFIIIFSILHCTNAMADLEKPVDFENDLIPIFTKMGCNAAACHGAAIGRGGFKLSLFGGNPQADYESIIHELEGRRVNLFKPKESLILLKPMATLPHGGGFLLNENNESTKLLTKWIEQGANFKTTRKLERVVILPKTFVFKEQGELIQLEAIAYYSNGTSEDVTNWTVFAAEDPSAVLIDAKTAQAKILRRGRHIVVARYLSAVVPLELLLPLTDNQVDLQDAPQYNFIDEEILSTLSILRLPLSTQTDDTAFLRRITLDLTGRLPKPEVVKDFLNNTNINKRKTVVNDLLASKECNEYLTLQVAKLFRVQGNRDDVQGAGVYHNWLYQQISNNAGYDQITRKVMLALGDTTENGPANFYRTVKGPRQQAEFMSELFMASRMRCANCHNHPLDRWTQDDYHGLAAIFANIENGPIVKLNQFGEVIHPQTTEPAVYRIPGERFLTNDKGDVREELVNWLVRKDNPYYAKAIVNRLWKIMMGRGLVEPSDDLRDTNPATHPALLTKLADHFIENGYQIKYTLRLIADSAVYARSSNATPHNQTDDRYYSYVRREDLEPEVLADAISDVLGIPDEYGDYPIGTRAVALFNPQTPSRALDILGRCGREQSCESSDVLSAGLPRMLHLLNGELLNARIGAPGGRLDQLISAQKTPMQIVNAFYLAALNRYPSNEETSYWEQHFKKDKTSKEQKILMEDFIWSLLTCNEFQTNH